jgi:glucose-6-phosphate-specific signal transduction histidine kinase
MSQLDFFADLSSIFIIRVVFIVYSYSFIFFLWPVSKKLLRKSEQKLKPLVIPSRLVSGSSDS